MAIGAVLGIAQAGLGIGQALFGPGSSPQIDTSAIRQTALRNVAIRAQNQRTKQIWQAQLNQAKEQFIQNKAAADRAYNSLQLKENEQLEAFLLKQKGMVKQLVEFQGKYKAREVYGKSAARLASQPEKEYGEAMRTMQMNMQRFNDQVDRDMAEVARQQQASNANVMAGISIPPAMVSELPMPSMQLPSSAGANMGLKIGSAILGGLSTFASMRAPAATGGGGDYSGGVATNAFEGASGVSAGSFGGFSGGTNFQSSNLSLGSFNPFGG